MLRIVKYDTWHFSKVGGQKTMTHDTLVKKAGEEQ